jgi:hypothetical protein
MPPLAPPAPAVSPAPAQPPAAQQEAPPPATGPASVSAAPAAAAAPGPAAATLSGLVQRLEKLEGAVSRVGQSEGASAQLQAQLGALANQLQVVNGRVDEILQHLPNTLGYGARETFTCGSCGAQGFVAVPIMCTHCRQQTWLGWWPQT